MASIDKIYVNFEQYKEVLNFFNNKNIKKFKNFLGYEPNIPKYVESDFVDGDLVLFNNTHMEDLWFVKYCKLPFIQDRLKVQYADNWIGWKKLKLSEKGFIISIEDKNFNRDDSYFAPYSFIDQSTIRHYDKILVYGTTYFIYALDKAYSIIENNSLFIDGDSLPFTVDFDIYGIHIKAVNILGDVKYYFGESDEELMLGKIDISRNFTKFKIKHSFNKKDYFNYKPQQIVLSFDDEFINVDMFKDFTFDQMDRYFSFLPKYIQNNLK